METTNCVFGRLGERVGAGNMSFDTSTDISCGCDGGAGADCGTGVGDRSLEGTLSGLTDARSRIDMNVAREDVAENEAVSVPNIGAKTGEALDIARALIGERRLLATEGRFQGEWEVTSCKIAASWRRRFNGD